MGFCRPAAFQSANGGVTVDEISLNPTYFDHQDRTEILSTLVHEMTHVEEFVNGTYSGGGYHNEIWGTLMERVGLMPSDTGEQGGKRTGTHMSHYVIKGGPFEREAERFLSKTVFAPMDARRYTAEEKLKIQQKNASKTKHSCGCQNAWAKLGSSMVCPRCRNPFVIVKPKMRLAA
jgi:predicted SprT family Zn-dependent metalloprotease